MDGGGHRKCNLIRHSRSLNVFKKKKKSKMISVKSLWYSYSEIHLQPWMDTVLGLKGVWENTETHM